MANWQTDSRCGWHSEGHCELLPVTRLPRSPEAPESNGMDVQISLVCSSNRLMNCCSPSTRRGAASSALRTSEKAGNLIAKRPEREFSLGAAAVRIGQSRRWRIESTTSAMDCLADPHVDISLTRRRRPSSGTLLPTHYLSIPKPMVSKRTPTATQAAVVHVRHC